MIRPSWVRSITKSYDHKWLRCVGAAIVMSGKCFVTQRSASTSLPLKWEFPGGKVEPGEDPRDALFREIGEELGLVIRVGEHVARGKGTAGKNEVMLDVYWASIASGELDLREHADARWATGDELGTLDWADADLPAVAKVRKALCGFDPLETDDG